MSHSTEGLRTKHLSREETVDNRLAALERIACDTSEALKQDNQRMNYLQKQLTDLAQQVQALMERFEAHSHEIDIHSTDRPTALAAHIGGTA
jgi:uncharacterized coiled-coil protein SlyX